MPPRYLRLLPGLTLAVFGVALLLLAAGAARTGAATPPQPTYGSAVVDGSSGEWIAGDFFATMHRAGNPNFAVLSNLYVRYDCSTNVLFVLVLSVGAEPMLNDATTDDDHFVKVDGPSTDVSAADAPPNGSQPEFAFITSGSDTIGWEASFVLAEGSYIDFNVHTQFPGGEDGETSAVADRKIPLVLDCPDNTEPPPTETDVPPTETDVPPTETDVPPTETDVPPTETEVPPTETDVPPTETEVPPTETSEPTATVISSTPDTPTDVPPTETSVPPTEPAPTEDPTEPAPTDPAPTDPAPTETAEAPPTNTPDSDTAGEITPGATNTPGAPATGTGIGASGPSAAAPLLAIVGLACLMGGAGLCLARRRA